MNATRIRTSCEKEKISLTYQSSRFRKSENVLSIMMHKHENNRNLSWRISNHDQKSKSRIHIRNSRIWEFQEAYERETARCDSLYYFMNKKLSVAFKRSQRHQRKWSEETRIW